MATTQEYVEFVCEQIKGVGDIRYRKMFGEYVVYVNDKLVMVVVDNEVFVKKLEIVENLMAGAPVGSPYTGAKEHYILDIEDKELSMEVVRLLEEVTLVPKPKKKKEKK